MARGPATSASRPSVASPTTTQVRLRVQDHAEPGPEQRLIVDEEDPDGLPAGAGPSLSRRPASISPRSCPALEREVGRAT